MLSDLKHKYSAWSPCTITQLLFVCSVDLYISYSLIIGDSVLECGFSSCKVIDDNSLYTHTIISSRRLLTSKGNYLSIESSDDSFFISLISVSPFLECTFSQNECTSFSRPFILRHLSVDSFSLQYTSEHSSELLSFYQQNKDSFLSVINGLLNQRKLSLSGISGIILYGSFVPLSLSTFISSISPSTPIIIDSSSMEERWRESCLGYAYHYMNNQDNLESFGKKGMKESEYIGEEVDGVREGYGEEFRFGVCVYRGFWKDNMHHGLGELMNEEGDLLYRGEFQKNEYEGMGILHINEKEILTGEFHHGWIVEGIHQSKYPNGQICYDGHYKRGLRNGVGKEYSMEGECVYEGCFLDNKKYGNGTLFTSTSSLEGSFVDDVFDGEVKEYSLNHVLLSVTSYDHGVQCSQGTFYTEDGYLLYEGGVLNGQYYSHGILYYPGGGIHYDGEFIDGMFSGYGQLYNKEGDLEYIGEFKKGMKDGHGKEYTSSTFLKYVGMYQNDMRHGHGKIFFAEGHYYEGDFKEGEVTGEGKMVWSDGRYYEGSFIQGRKEGKGVYCWNDNQCYKGDWKEDKREGKGIQYDENGVIVYEGDWREDRPSGKGTIHYANGSYYVGDVVQNRREGKGIQYNKNDVKDYEGEWKNDLPHGYGCFYYDDKSMYEGQWVNGEREGPGRILYASGNSFIGVFKKGHRHGKGCLLNPRGKILREEVFE